MGSQDDGIIEDCRRRFSEGAELEEILQRLRDAGYSKGQSMVVLVKSSEMSLTEAKTAIHLSRTWSDRLRRDELLHDRLIKKIHRDG